MRELLVYLDLEQLFNFLFKKFKYVCQVSFHKAKIFECLARLVHSVCLYLAFHSWNQLSIGIPKRRLWKTITQQWVQSYTILTKDSLMVNWKKLLIIDYWYNLAPPCMQWTRRLCMSGLPSWKPNVPHLVYISFSFATLVESGKYM